VASAAVKDTVSAALYQPFEFGCRDGVAAVCGAVASYFSGSEATPVFPALSTQEPLTAAAASSGPEYVFAAGHEAGPEVASVAAKLTVSGALYQPFAFGGREGAAAAWGAVAS
jgi:hypothetical protein